MLLLLPLLLGPDPQEPQDSQEPEHLRRPAEVVRAHADVMLAHGRDRYGEVSSPLFVAVLDARTRTCPAEPEPLAALVRLEGRLHRRGERGANVWYDQAFLRALGRLGGEYAEAADDCLRAFLTTCRKREGEGAYRTGLPAWGTHVYWDVFTDAPGGDMDGDGPHELLIYVPEWAAMWRVAPDETRALVEGLWRWHVVDDETGQHNRHDDDRVGCDFAFHGGSLVLAFAAAHAATGEATWLERAARVADWHAGHRHPETGLLADAPSTGSRYDALHCMTSVTGPFCLQLCRASEVSGDPRFAALARDLLLAYDRHGWDEAAGTYHGMLTLDGRPIADHPANEGYGVWAPDGHVDVWRTLMFSYEFPLATAQATLAAHAATGDERLLPVAQRWARAIEAAGPPSCGRRWGPAVRAALGEDAPTGAYAESYGRAIAFFDRLGRVTGEEQHRARARALAQEAVERLVRDDLVCGHPGKPYYEVTDGVGLLLCALLELESDEPVGVY